MKIVIYGVNHSKISAIADDEPDETRATSGVNHSKISAVADEQFYAQYNY